MQAQLADGRTLEFPDGTDPAVIQSTVKRLLGQGDGPEPQPLTTGETALGAAKEGLQGATLGFADEIEALIAAGFATTANEAMAKIRQMSGTEGPIPTRNPSFDENLDQAEAELRQERGQFVEENPLTSIGLNIAGGLVTGGSAIKGAQTAGKAIATGVGLGGASGLGFSDSGSPFDDESLTDTAVGAVLGGIFPIAGLGTKQLLKAIGPALGVKTAGVIKRFGGDELLRSTLKRVQSARRLGLTITPAEATGRAQLAARQGKLGGTDKGFTALEKFGTKRSQDERRAITNFLEDLSPDGSSANNKARSVAKSILGDKETILATAAKPLYKQAYSQRISDEALESLTKDPVIKSAFEKMLKTPAFQRELGDTPLSSIKALDLVKRTMDDQIDGAVDQFGRITNEGRVIRSAKNDLLKVADEASPSFKEARAIFSNDAPGLQKIKESVVGKIAKMDDQAVKNISKTIFDPSQTDINVIRKIATEFRAKDPATWRRITRNEIERRLDISKRGRSGTALFDSVLKSDRDFNLFLAATKGDNRSRQALIDMRRAFKDLINPVTVKTAAGQSRSSLDVPRSTSEAVINLIKDMTGAKFDKAAVEVITNPEWYSQLTGALAGGSKKIKTEKFLSLIGAAAGAEQSDQ